MFDMKVEWGSIWSRRIDPDSPFWLVVEYCESEEQGNARAAQLQAEDPAREYEARKFELVPKWQVEESVELETEQAVVLGKDMKFI